MGKQRRSEHKRGSTRGGRPGKVPTGVTIETNKLRGRGQRKSKKDGGENGKTCSKIIGRGSTQGGGKKPISKKKKQTYESDKNITTVQKNTTSSHLGMPNVTVSGKRKTEGTSDNNGHHRHVVGVIQRGSGPGKKTCPWNLVAQNWTRADSAKGPRYHWPFRGEVVEGEKNERERLRIGGGDGLNNQGAKQKKSGPSLAAYQLEDRKGGVTKSLPKTVRLGQEDGGDDKKRGNGKWWIV